MDSNEKMQPGKIVITGVAHGIGRYLAKNLGNKENEIALIFRVRDHRAVRLIEECRNNYKNVLPLYGDISDEKTSRNVFHKIQNKMQAITAMIHCVGPVIYSNDILPTNEEIIRMIEGNVLTSANIIRDAQDMMIRNNFGRIVVFGFSGIDSAIGFKRVTAYAAAKEALMVIIRSIAKKLIVHNITINVISPGIIDMGEDENEWNGYFSQKIPMKRLGMLNEIVSCVKWLLRSESNYLTGQNLKISGGLHI